MRPLRAPPGPPQVSVVARERNELLCTGFTLVMRRHYAAEQLVFLDETAKDERTLARRYGYSMRGRRAPLRAPFVRGERFTATAAIATMGLIAYDVVLGASNAERLHRFIVDLLVGWSVQRLARLSGLTASLRVAARRAASGERYPP